MCRDLELVDFPQALAALEGGARGVRRQGWTDADLFIFLNSVGRASMGFGPDAPVARVPLPERSSELVAGVDLSAIDLTDEAVIVRIPTINGWYRDAGFRCWRARHEDLTATDWYVV